MPVDQNSNGLACAPQSTPDFYLGDEWFVQPSLYRIIRGRTRLRVGPKVMHVLVCLAQAPGQVVRRDALMDSVWPDSHVVEEALTRCVSTLRKMLGDDPQHPEIIETIRNVGYRLLAPVSNTAPAAKASGDTRQRRDAAPRGSRLPMARKLVGSPRSMLLVAGMVVLLIVSGLVAVRMWLPDAVPSASPLQPVPLTSYPGEERGGVLSPDGEKIAFTWRGESGKNVDIFVKDIGSETLIRLTDHPALDVSPAWSPDGQHVAFMRRASGGTCTLLLASAVGGHARTIGSCGRNRSGDLAWSADGEWLAYSDRPEPNTPSRIVLTSPAHREHRILTHPPESLFGDVDPSFSPDSRYVAFTRRASAETFDLYVISLATGTEQRLSFDERLIRGHTWAPDGQSIIFASNRAGTFSLWRVPVAGGTPAWVATNGIEQAFHPSTARRGNRLVFQHVMNEVNIWQVDLHASFEEEARPSPLLVSSQVDVMPQFSPDNRHIAFISNRSGYFELWVAERDGSGAMPVTAMDGAVTGDPCWSPDGSHIVFSSLLHHQSDVYVVNVETGQLRQLTAAPSDDWVPRWSRDGQWIYFTSDRSGSWQIWKVPADGGEAVQITDQGGRSAQESVDGRYLYIARSDTAGIWQMPSDGGEPRLVLDRTAAYDWGSWTVVEDGLYFIDRRSPQGAISFLQFDTGQVTAVASLPVTSVRNITRGIPSLTVSPDRNHIAYAQFDRRESDIVMVEVY